MTNKDISDGIGLEEATGKEMLPYSNYHRETKRLSRLIPDMVVGSDDEGTMNCPRCNESRPGIPHGESITCGKCGLHMERYGNALFISEE